MSTKNRIQAALAAKKLRVKPAAVESPVGAAVPPKENPLIPLSRDLVARTAGGKDALIAMKAIKDWKSSEAIRRAHGSLSDYYDVLVELHEAGTLKLKGENFMNTEKIDGAEYGLNMHEKWVKAGRPGTFTAFLEAERKRESEEGKERTKAAGGGK